MSDNLQPIPGHDRNLDRPAPENDLTSRQFRAYAARAQWDGKTIDLLLKGFAPSERFMCGGRLIKVTQ